MKHNKKIPPSAMLRLIFFIRRINLQSIFLFGLGLGFFSLVLNQLVLAIERDLGGIIQSVGWISATLSFCLTLSQFLMLLALLLVVVDVVVLILRIADEIFFR